MVNVRNRANGTPIHWAAYNGHTECLNVLLERGAQVNVQSSKGSTPLHLVAMMNHTECLNVLLINDVMILILLIHLECPLGSVTYRHTLYGLFWWYNKRRDALFILLKKPSAASCGVEMKRSIASISCGLSTIPAAPRNNSKG
jgi:ankyrin repeat protein